MAKPLRALIAEDNESDADLVLLALEGGGFDVTARRVEHPDDFRAALSAQVWDIVISDYAMPHFSAPGALACLRASGLDVPFIVVSGTIGEETAVEMMRAGADDYIMKDNLTRLPASIDHELSNARTRRERTEALEALRSSEERYHSLFENAPMAIWEGDLSEVKAGLDALSAKGIIDFREFFRDDPEALRDLALQVRVVDMNDAAVRIHRAPSREALLAGPESAVVEDAYPVLEDLFCALAAGTTMLDMEVPFGADLRHAILHLFVVPGHEQDLSRVIVALVDITERRQAEIALGTEKERLAVTLGSIADCVIATDISGRITLMNKAAEALTGWTEREATGGLLEDVMPLVNREMLNSRENPLWTVLRTNAPLDLPLGTATRSRHGKELMIAASASPIRDARGEVMGVVLVFRDTTEEQMLRAEALKAQKLEALGILAGGIAHDFNNVLVVVGGNLQMARLFPREDAQHAALLESAEHACLKASSLTQQLLTFARGGAPIKQVTSIETMVRDTALFALSGSNVGCNFIVDDELWTVEADVGQISQVISNLVINADQAMPEGGSLQVTLSNVTLPEGTPLPLDAGDYIAISVQDEGTGIPPEYLERVFDPYFTTKKRGSGLGLASCYSVVRNHGGHITVSSAVGVGSIFTTYLPASKQQARVDEAPVDRIPRGTGRILVMDDEETVLEFAVMVLEELGYEVTPVQTGEAAIAAYQEAAHTGRLFAAVLLDLTIRSGLGGKETLQQLRKVDPDVRAVVCSGYSADPVMAYYSEYGFKAVVVKPYEVADLGRAMAAAIGD